VGDDAVTFAIENSKRIKALRRELIKAIPRFPNDKASLQAIKAKDLTDLLITYVGWRLRYVAPRQRTVTGQGRLASDPRAAVLQSNIDAFIKAVQAGDDLTPYLSLLPHTQGYTPAADPGAPKGSSWADKDFLLNVMGLHHFHLGLLKEAKGHMARTNEVLFASVTRTNLDILGLFDHAAFENDVSGAMTPERQKLWAVYEDLQRRAALPGQLLVGGYAGLGITMSSSPVAVVRAAQRHVQIMQEVDPKLDNPAFVASLYGAVSMPKKPKLRWHYRHLDLGLLDEQVGFFGILEKGPN
jgi:hypothetical protein